MNNEYRRKDTDNNILKKILRTLRGASDVETSQTALNAATAVEILPARASRRFAHIKNIDAALVVYVGAAGVTSSTGFALAAGQTVVLETTAAIFAIAASGTPSVAVLETFDA